MNQKLRKVEAMHALFGKVPTRNCKDCPHLVRHDYARSYYKCECYGESSAESTDWALSWTACGMIEGDHWRWYAIKARDGCVVNMLKHEPKGTKKKEQCEGQIRLEDL